MVVSVLGWHLFFFKTKLFAAAFSHHLVMRRKLPRGES